MSDGRHGTGWQSCHALAGLRRLDRPAYPDLLTNSSREAEDLRPALDLVPVGGEPAWLAVPPAWLNCWQGTPEARMACWCSWMTRNG